MGWFTALYPVRLHAGPGTQGARQRGQQQVVDLQALRLQRRAEQLAGDLGVEAEARVGGLLPGGGGVAASAVQARR
ncbi:hypothetical protein, partial [Pseudomonas sp. Pseusp97]|uniref:hypothetical protein n=1 Tax=Pseudomonas sp. Pseusp97 TaxID=3243065 RepID=UPI0039A7300B